MNRIRDWRDLAALLSILLSIVPASAGAEGTPRNLRTWHTDGQTFLVWEHSDQGPPISDTYSIYRSDQPITTIDGAELIGIVSADNGSNRRLQGYVPTIDARWRLPTGFGVNYELMDNEAYFVVTPREEGVRYYAVTPSGGISILPGSNSMLDPVTESIDPVTCTIQYQDEQVVIYGHWIDGRSDPDSGRADYPVMGNRLSNGLGFDFAVWLPESGLPFDEFPMVGWLHGAGQCLVTEEVVRYANRLVPDGLFVSFDDPLPIGTISPVDGVTFWFGYTDEFDRFDPDSVPGDSSTVIDYTARRVWWTTEWLIEKYRIDPRRITLAGHSMGGAGAVLHSQLRPDLYAAALAYVPPLVLREAGGNDRFHPIFGTVDQNLPTNIEGETGIWDLLDLKWRNRLPHPDWPYSLIVTGKADSSAPWEVSRDVYLELDESRVGYALYWDERSHDDCSGSYFCSSSHLSPAFLTRFRRADSYPAFSNTDDMPWLPGRQPDPGNGDPEDGDPWGTWGGYLEWDGDDIIDTPDRWECTLRVTSESRFGSDIPESDTLLTDVTPRNLQLFSPGDPRARFDSRPCYWELIDRTDGSLLQEGTILPEPDGSLVVRDLRISKDPSRLVLRNHRRQDRVAW